MATPTMSCRRIVHWALAVGIGISGVAATATAAKPTADRPTLFRDVNVIAMTDDRVSSHRDVLVRNGRIDRIAAAGALSIPADALIIDGQGRYLMPGLTEMHGHLPGPQRKQYAHDVLMLYLAHGVTTVRGMLGDPWHLELRSQLERNQALGPRLFTAGPSLNGGSVPDTARAVSIVRDQAAAGYSFLKLHPGLTRAVFDTIVTTANAHGITFQGHISEHVGVLRALEARQRAIDHLDGYLEELAESKCRSASTASGFFGIGVLQCVDEQRIPDLVRRTKAAGTWMVPTMQVMEQWAYPPTAEQLHARPAVRYMPRDVVSKWLDVYRQSTAGQTLTPELMRRFVEVRRSLLREMYRQQVPIALGSDAPQIFNVPGDSALEELRLYAEIGFTAYDALKSATISPAVFFGAADQFGAVREGLAADLVLLRDNPLADVRAVRQLTGVMVRGRWLSRTDIDTRLADIAARVNGAASP